MMKNISYILLYARPWTSYSNRDILFFQAFMFEIQAKLGDSVGSQRIPRVRHGGLPQVAITVDDSRNFS